MGGMRLSKIPRGGVKGLRLRHSGPRTARGQLLPNRGDPGDGSGGVGALRAPGAAVRPEQLGMPGVPPGPAPAPAALGTGGVAGEGSPGNSPGEARRGAAGDPPPPRDPARRLPPCPSRSRRVPGSTWVRGPGADSPAVRTPRRRSGPRAPGRSGRAPRSAAGPEPAAAAAGPVGGLHRPGLPGAPRPRPAPPGGAARLLAPPPRPRLLSTPGSGRG